MKKLLPLVSLLLIQPAHANPLEVLHWWTAPGELEAQAILKEALAQQNVDWKNFAIVGAGGNSALRVLQMRALSGNPPDAAQIKGPDIAEWAKMGLLKNIESFVPVKFLDKHLPDIVKKTVRYNNHYMALPLNIHRVNWLWLNKAIFDELQLVPPKTWKQFFIVADKIKQAGYLPLAHGGTAWQDSLLFESVALSLLGADKYRQAFVEFDKTILTSAEMIAVFKKFKQLNLYISKEMQGKDWTFSSQMISDKKAAMLFMGDWVKGMWHASGKVAMQDYLCVDVPESAGLFSYNIDSFVFFNKNSNDLENSNSQTFAHTLLSREFQNNFNIEKGSIPVRLNMDMQAFDSCSQKSYYDFNHAQLVPSFSQNMASSSYLQNEMNKIISYYFNNEEVSAEQTVKRLSLAIRALNK
ncbi:ABC transporter substrate-binding protein [Psychromonas hadalis]|uniref:ABC transporter substrate-binding protein n=1 Tax=Psychromonas hadalis TaxID=211669 RepID=UPI0003B501FF|nr:ABC transporter substrate-binding protein [Psychromonas hadalis]